MTPSSTIYLRSRSFRHSDQNRSKPLTLERMFDRARVVAHARAHMQRVAIARRGVAFRTRTWYGSRERANGSRGNGGRHARTEDDRR